MVKFIAFIFFVFAGTISQQNAKLKIEIKELKNNKGKILLQLQNQEKEIIKGVSKEISNNSCSIILDSLPPGNYSFRYIHDENNNKELDTNFIGIPKEGYGFSNNAKGTFGPPQFEKTIFKFNSDTLMICTPMYIKN